MLTPGLYDPDRVVFIVQGNGTHVKFPRHSDPDLPNLLVTRHRGLIRAAGRFAHPTIDASTGDLHVDLMHTGRSFSTAKFDLCDERFMVRLEKTTRLEMKSDVLKSFWYGPLAVSGHVSTLSLRVPELALKLACFRYEASQKDWQNETSFTLDTLSLHSGKALIDYEGDKRKFVLLAERLDNGLVALTVQLHSIRPPYYTPDFWIGFTYMALEFQQRLSEAPINEADDDLEIA